MITRDPLPLQFGPTFQYYNTVRYAEFSTFTRLWISPESSFETVVMENCRQEDGGQRVRSVTRVQGNVSNGKLNWTIDYVVRVTYLFVWLFVQEIGWPSTHLKLVGIHTPSADPTKRTEYHFLPNVPITTLFVGSSR